MLSIVHNQTKLPTTKKNVKVTGTLANVLVPGAPAVYLYHGNLIRTTVVEAILEASPDHVSFETRNTIYTLSYIQNTITGSNTA